MKRMNLIIRAFFAMLFLLAAAVPDGATLPASAASAETSPLAAGGGDLLAFQLVAPGQGWALIGQEIYWTDSGGAQWQDITPPDLGPDTIRAASFADWAHGWVVATAQTQTGELSYALARTADGGRTWQSQRLALFARGDAAGMAGEVFLQFIDARAGWLVVKQATSLNFSLGTLFKTNDGGVEWTRLSLPTGAPVRFTNALDGQIDASAAGKRRYVTHDGGQTWAQQPDATGGDASAPDGASTSGLSGVSMATAQFGWAKSAAGTCETGTCVLVTKLVATHDGGQTWTPVKLPGGQAAMTESLAAPSSAAAAQSAGGLRVTFDGQGFDSCKNDGSIPALSDMQTWYNDSPYRVWNLYLGGSSLADCGTLTRAYLQQLAQQGWLFIPTWVGPQAPCSPYGHRMASDANTARSQGVIEADLARNVARSLGLTLSDLSGTVIYYDVEFYLGDQACLDAVKAFISGWSGELRANSIQAGVYGAPCGQSLSAFAGIPNVPDMIWIARWQLPAAYDPNASVWGSTICGLSNTLWTNHQRLHQYAGGHNETWGSVTFNIDNDVISANIATVTDACSPDGGHAALFVYPNYSGQCVVKIFGRYPTAASIGLPAQSISSLSVGGGITVTLCQGEFYAPPCSSFTGNQADLSGTAVGARQTSSMIISTTLPLTNMSYLPLVAGQPAP